VQSDCPAGHVVVHTPALHACPAPQTLPHAPQLVTSKLVIVQEAAPPSGVQSVWPAGHTVAHVP
jgi:hypothetical protein